MNSNPNRLSIVIYDLNNVAVMARCLFSQMPLPHDPLVLSGGCKCKAIRYVINVPALSKRPINPPSQDTIHFPFVTTDHCNDC